MLERAKGAIDLRRTGLIAAAETKIKKGATIPGWGLQDTFGRQKWRLTDESVIATIAAVAPAVTVAKPCVPITPKQAITAGVDPVIVASISETPKTGTKLAVDDGSAARQIFAKQ